MTDTKTDIMEVAKYDDKGLLTAIAQDADNGEILMVAFMNETALRQTIETGTMTYWSRSRQKLWVKGESSGHTQKVVEARVDCDGDAMVFRVRQEGGACHVGYRSCFFRRHTDEGLVVDGERVFDPEKVYS